MTPSSKVVGDLALALVGANVSAAEFAADPKRVDLPDSVVGFLRGELGVPAGGRPDGVRERVFGGDVPTEVQVQDVATADLQALQQFGTPRRATLNRLLFPGPTAEFLENRRRYGDTTRLSANQFFYGLRHREEHKVVLAEGVEVLIELEAIGEPDDKGMRTVMLVVNGQLRPVEVRDRAVTPSAPAAQKADPTVVGQIGAPFGGVVSTTVEVGEEVEAGQVVAGIEAMKWRHRSPHR